MIQKFLQGTDKISKQLNLEFHYSTAKHNFETGLPLENALKNFFRPYFPLKYGFSSGYIVDFESNESGQCDWIIYDAINCTPLISNSSNSGIEWFPFDGIYGTIEVKRTLDKAVFKKALRQVQSVKQLIRKNNDFLNFNPVVRIPKAAFNLKKGTELPISNKIISGIYAYSIKQSKASNNYFKPENLLKELNSDTFEIPYEELPDFIAIHGEFIIIKVQLLKKNRGEIWRFNLIEKQNNGFAWIKTNERTSGVFYLNLLTELSYRNLSFEYQLELARLGMKQLEKETTNNGELFINKKYFEE